MDQKEKLALIQQQIDDARDGNPENFRLWREKTDVVLRNVLGDTNASYRSFQTIRYTPGMWTDSTPRSRFQEVRAAGVRNAIAVLEAAKVEVELSGGVPEPAHAERAAGTNVFIVHGRDDARKHEVARFVRNITGYEPTILHEMANSGRTIIEKFEQHAAMAAYAIVIATGDDLGRAATETGDNPRARQNVVFELGFFFGSLGRSRVAFLHEEGVELPSDINGIVYVRLDPGGAWRATLAREMEDAGMGVDWAGLRYQN